VPFVLAVVAAEYASDKPSAADVVAIEKEPHSDAEDVADRDQESEIKALEGTLQHLLRISLHVEQLLLELLGPHKSDAAAADVVVVVSAAVVSAAVGIASVAENSPDYNSDHIVADADNEMAAHKKTEKNLKPQPSLVERNLSSVQSLYQKTSAAAVE